MSATSSLLTYKLCTAESGAFAFSTTRHGGVSRGKYASLNCTPYTGDDPVCICRNQEILRSALPYRPNELIIPYQTHGIRSVVIDDIYLHDNEAQRHALLQETDALITRETGCCLCISTADCIPVLLHDCSHHVVAAIHAGWRGTAKHIVTATLARMQDLYGTTGQDVTACIGPGISLQAFEIDDEVYEAFQAQGFPMPYISEWKPATHKWHIDLWAANRLQLHDFGIPQEQIETVGICTHTHYDDFFSARRLGIHSGRILSGIMLTD